MKGILNRTAWGRQDIVLAVVAAIGLLAWACGGGGGVAEVRAGFIAQIQSFAVQAPAVDEAMVSDEEEADAEAAGEMPAEPVPVNVMLDILVHNEGSGTLDGITVDLTIADPDGMEKERRLLWIETAGLIKGSQSQVVHELHEVAYTEGDGFHVEVRHPIPMEERGDYREFDAEE